ncbi:hypothetical protein [Cohnella candidum]|uniref:Hsp20/alpha crystallin family protein n=1 Tax=Cohnella candidum TaxID=2674991 RepID=A0A3G3JYC6_9BACL|nr:hypothetical protein [Cohnella candidum]AYQ72857.1 hypothetical protein EAV92_09950 [Cohnella candidum]
MSSFFGSGPLPDWSEFRKWLGKEIPWKLVEQWDQAENGEWLDSFVRGMMKKEIPETPKAESRSLFQIDTVKNAKNLTVTMRIPPGTHMRDLRLFATSDRLRITGLSGQRSHNVRFPCRVFPRSGRAEQSGDRVTMVFKRRPSDGQEVELFIRG